MFSPQSLRHTTASLLLWSSVADVYHVQRMLGHLDIALTANTYAGHHQRHCQPDLDAFDRTVIATPGEATG